MQAPKYKCKVIKFFYDEERKKRLARYLSRGPGALISPSGTLDDLGYSCEDNSMVEKIAINPNCLM